MNPRIQRLRRRFAPEAPKARYFAVALLLESSLLAMTLWIPGPGRLHADDLSQGLQVEAAWHEAVELVEEEQTEPEHALEEDPVEITHQVELPRFRIMDAEPLPTDLPRPTPEAVPVEQEIPEEAWLVRIKDKPVEEPVAKEIPSPASKAQVRLLPLEGRCPKPQYPARAVRVGLEGTILFRIHVDAAGAVARLEILEQDCPRILLRAAEKALHQWRFQGGPGVYDKRIVFSLEDRD